MTKYTGMTIDDIRRAWPSKYVEAFDEGVTYDAYGCERRMARVVVWESEQDSDNDAGTKALASYLMPYEASGLA